MDIPVNVKILGTNALFRECLATVLAREGPYEVSELASELEKAWAELESEPPDVLLVDLSRSRDEVLELVRKISRESDLKVLLVGMETSEEEALVCMESGAKGYVPIGSSLAELHHAIEKIVAGGVAYSAEMTPLMFSRLAELSSEHRRNSRWDALELTTRELEILSLIARGLRNKDLAERLSLSLHTVKNHVHHVLKKLDAPNRTEAVRIAMKHGWLKRWT